MGLLRAWPCGRKLSAIWPLKESLNLLLPQGETGLERSLRASGPAESRLPTLVAEIWSLSAGAKYKRSDRVWGEGEKDRLIALPGKGAPQQASALKTVPPIGKHFEEC